MGTIAERTHSLPFAAPARVAYRLAAAVSLTAALAAPGDTRTLRAWLLTVGFASLAAALSLPPARTWAPAAIAGFFALFGGLSAVIATSSDSRLGLPGYTDALALERVGLLVERTPRLDEALAVAFTKAIAVTTLGGLAAVGAAVAVDRFAGAASLGRPPLRDVRRAATTLVAIGVVAALVAVGRFVVVELPAGDLWAGTRSFWQGGSYLLLAATVALPGFALLLGDPQASRRQLAWACVGLAGFVLLLAPSGQRGFAIQAAVVVATALLARRRLPVRAALPGVLAMVVLLGATQAVRNELRETGAVTAGGTIARLQPDRLGVLYGSQLASFQWTWDVAAYGDRLELPNTFVHALEKPVPRQLLPGKVQGFGDEFTRRLYPKAHEQGIAFSVPIVAEAYANFGAPGLVLVLALLGAAFALAELYVVRGAPPALRVALGIAVGWSAFLFLRGDLANALVFASAWIVPVGVVALGAGFRPLLRRDRVVIDALQVPPEFSGVGRMVLSIGQELDALDQPLEVRCGADVAETLRAAFPERTQFRLPVASSRPRILRVAYQQLVAPVLDPRSSLIVCPGDQAPAWGRARVLLAVYDVRRISTPERVPRLERLFYRLLVPRGARRAEVVVTASRFSRGELERVVRGTPKRVRVVGHHPPVRAVDDALAEGVALVVVGAMRPYKGVETVLDALARVDSHERPPLALVGSTEGRAGELQRYALVRGLSQSVRIQGWVDDDALERVYTSALASVSPSTYEGYGLSVAESLAAGVPTIASDIPPHREIANGAALFFPPGDVEALADLIRLVVRDTALRERLRWLARERARTLSVSGPSWGEVIADAAGSA
jgi:glycosyltransferase involved in cell wall biosynthesis